MTPAISCGNRIIPKQSSPDSAPFGAMLLPESEAKQRDGKSQKPGTQRREESTQCPGSQSSGESERQATTDRRQGTQDRRQRGRDARSLPHCLSPFRASSTAR